MCCFQYFPTEIKQTFQRVQNQAKKKAHEYFTFVSYNPACCAILHKTLQDKKKV